MASSKKADGGLPTGFTCSCGECHLFPPYVYAHWTEILGFVCPKCSRNWDVLRGVVIGRAPRSTKTKKRRKK